MVTTLFLHREPGDNQQLQLAETVGVPMCQAMMEYDQGNYNRAVELLYPLRYRMVDIGGSDAQVGSTEISRMAKVKQVQSKLQFFYAKLKHFPL